MHKMHRDIEELRTGTQSPRPETPEPDSRQGRRNSPAAGVQLLDDDGAISVQVRVFQCVFRAAWSSSRSFGVWTRSWRRV